MAATGLLTTVEAGYLSLIVAMDRAEYSTVISPVTIVTTAAAAVDVVAALALVAVADFEHVKTIRPSTLITVFLFTTILLDMARVRSFWLETLNGLQQGLAVCKTATLAVKLVILFTENCLKRACLLPPAMSVSEKETPLSTESTGGPFHRALFLWLNKLLKQGWRTALRPDTLPDIDGALAAEHSSRRLEQAWHAVDHSRPYALLLSMIKAFWPEMARVLLLRLILIGLSIAQPFLIGQMVDFLQGSPTASISTSNNAGYGLIGAFALVYIGVAVSRH